MYSFKEIGSFQQNNLRCSSNKSSISNMHTRVPCLQHNFEIIIVVLLKVSFLSALNSPNVREYDT